MTISAYTGLPGHGKSYGVVENVIAPALKQKREVFTNIPMNEDECLKRFAMAPIHFDTQDIIDNPNWWTEVFHSGALIVIDELWRLWPQGLTANKVRETDKAFLAEHRHMVGENGFSTEIVLVTQDLSQISAFARILVETTYRVMKLSKLGLNKCYRVDVYFGPVTGVNPPASKRDRVIQGVFKSKTFSLYKSHTKSKTGGAGDETRIDNRFNALKGSGIILSLLLFPIVGYFVWNGSQQVFGFFGQGKQSVDVNIDKNHVVFDVVQSKFVSKKPVFKFLAKAKNIIISYNNGHWPNIEYQYKIIFGDSESTFNYADFQRLGYSLEPVNQCLVKINGPDYAGFAMCEPEHNDGGWFPAAVASSVNSH